MAFGRANNILDLDLRGTNIEALLKRSEYQPPISNRLASL
jgi:hypothetical protein